MTPPVSPVHLRIACWVQARMRSSGRSATYGGSEPIIHSVDTGAAAASQRVSQPCTCSSRVSACSTLIPRSSATLVGMALSTNGTPSRSATAGPTTEPPAPYVAEIVTTCMRRPPVPEAVRHRVEHRGLAGRVKPHQTRANTP